MARTRSQSAANCGRSFSAEDLLTASTSTVTTYTPAQIRAAYGLPALASSASGVTSAQAAQMGAGQTIYLIDAYNDPNIAAELATFDSKFGLPGCTLTAISPAASLPLAAASATGCTLSVVYGTPSASMAAAAPAYNSGWAMEIALDVQWAHATAPYARIVLIEAAPRILPALPERISAATHALLTKLGVEVRTGARVSEVRADGVCLADGTFIPSELVVWSAGVKGGEFLKNLDGLETNRINQIVVEQTLQTTVDKNIFAMGDCAACPRPGFPQGVPPRAQAAHQQASHLFKELTKIVDAEGKTTPAHAPYIYRDFGSLVSLGHYSTVGSLMGFIVGRSMFIEGYFARLMYRSLYKMHQAALHGGPSVIWRTIVGLVARQPGPGVKLH